MTHDDLVSDDLWEAIAPFLPQEPPKPEGGRPRIPDRAALAGIVSILTAGMPSRERLGRHRWVVERTLAWLLGCRRLGVRSERRADLLQGLCHLACALLCPRFLDAGSVRGGLGVAASAAEASRAQAV